VLVLKWKNPRDCQVFRYLSLPECDNLTTSFQSVTGQSSDIPSQGSLLAGAQHLVLTAHTAEVLCTGRPIPSDHAHKRNERIRVA
jgi:hypothetical protein